MKKYVMTFIKIIIFLFIFVVIFNQIDLITRRKYAYTKTKSFFEQEEDFDVLFFGSSHMINSVYPMQLWNDYGIVSYNMANHAERIAISYYNIQMTLQEKKPKLIVIDAFMANYWDKIDFESNGEANLHNTIDIYPASLLKVKAIKDIYGNKATLNKYIEYLFPFSMYHARWNAITKDDFEYNYDIEKGAETKVAVTQTNKMSKFDSIPMYTEQETPNMTYLRKIIEYCKENGIEVLVVEIPYPAVDIEISKSKYYKKICDEYSVNYINFIGSDVVNYNIDFFDKTAHLNPSGGRKVTDYLGKYIIENYNIADHREDVNYDFWNQDYDKYIDFKIKKLKENEKYPANYLMLLYNEHDIKYDIFISNTSEMSFTRKELLKNLDNNYKIDDEIFKDNKDKTMKITTYDNRNGNKISDVWF